MDDITSYFYVKCVGSRYMIFKQSYNKHICLLPNKPKYDNNAAYKVCGKSYDGTIPLYKTSPKYVGNLTYDLEICLYCYDANSVFYLFVVATPELNVAPEKIGPSSLDKFSYQPDAASAIVTQTW